MKRENDLPQSTEEHRMYTIALENLEHLQPAKRQDYMQRDRDFNITGDKYEYEKGIMCVMKEGGIDGAKFHALNSR